MHVAIIMDGNGRWAELQGRPRLAGHTAGARVVRQVVEAAARLDVTTLTLYAFSADNWKRPITEVSHLMRLLERHLRTEVERCIEHGIRLKIIGRRDRLQPAVLQAIEAAEAATADCPGMVLQIAIDYSARDTILAAGRKLALEWPGIRTSGEPPPGALFEQAMIECMHGATTEPTVDLLIRTGGQQRLSDFLLFESAYAELLFIDEFWPDFTEQKFAECLAEFATRERKFGGLPGEEKAERSIA